MNNHNLITVRWRRKPRWLPTARSKVFKVPQRPNKPQEEHEEIKRLYNNYRTHMKSIRRYLFYRYSTELESQSNTEQQQLETEEDFIRCSKINDEWNGRCKVEREKRLEELLKKDVLLAKEKIESIRMKKEEQLQMIEEIVRQEKEASATYITAENIDAAIEEALNKEVDYNFAIDLDGNRYEGRETEPNLAKDEVKQ